MPGVMEDKSQWPRLRQCIVRKSYSGEEYGFNLHAERGKGQFIGDVDPASPAERGGLRAGDRIIAVNGTIVLNDMHREVVGRIKSDPLQCELLVINEEGFKWYQERQIAFTLDLPTDDQSLEATQVRLHRFMHSLPLSGDHLQTSGNSQPVQSRSGSHTSQQSKPRTNSDHGSHTAEPVVAPPPPVPEDTTSSPQAETASPRRTSSAANGSVHSNRTPPPYEPAVVVMNGSGNNNEQHVRARPLLCKLVKTKVGDEFGFNLHVERNRGHFVGQVDPQSIAHLSGLVLGQRVVGVNGTLVFPDSRHEVSGCCSICLDDALQ